MANNSKSLAREQLESTLENFGEEVDVNVAYDPNDRFVDKQIEPDSTDTVAKVGFIGGRFDDRSLRKIIKRSINECVTIQKSNVQIYTVPSTRNSTEEHKYYVVF